MKTLGMLFVLCIHLPVAASLFSGAIFSHGSSPDNDISLVRPNRKNQQLQLVDQESNDKLAKRYGMTPAAYPEKHLYKTKNINRVLVSNWFIKKTRSGKKGVLYNQFLSGDKTQYSVTTLKNTFLIRNRKTNSKVIALTVCTAAFCSQSFSNYVDYFFFKEGKNNLFTLQAMSKEISNERGIYPCGMMFHHVPFNAIYYNLFSGECTELLPENHHIFSKDSSSKSNTTTPSIIFVKNYSKHFLRVHPSIGNFNRLTISQYNTLKEPIMALSVLWKKKSKKNKNPLIASCASQVKLNPKLKMIISPVFKALYKNLGLSFEDNNNRNKNNNNNYDEKKERLIG